MNNSQTYHKVFLLSWQSFLENFNKGSVKLRSEHDIACHLFSECLKTLEELKFEYPYKIHVDIRPFPHKINKIADLILGDNEVVVEIKFLKSGESATTEITKKATKDVVDKLVKYIKQGAKYAFFIMVDENGHSKRRIWGKWTTSKIRENKSYFLLLEVFNDEASGKPLIRNEPEILKRYKDSLSNAK